MLVTDLLSQYADGKRDFCGADLRWADLRWANLREADLRWADLREANLGGAKLRWANLGGANLGGANLGGAKGLPQSVRVEHLDALILSDIENEGFRLDMSAWHICKTTHCRSGHAIRRAGPAGTLLEELYGAAAAGSIIYAVSTGSVPDFYASNKDAMESIRAGAALDPLPVPEPEA